MKIVKILKKVKNADENQIKSFIYKNLSQELINGLEYDDPHALKRALKLFGVDYDLEAKNLNVEEDKKSNEGSDI